MRADLRTENTSEPSALPGTISSVLPKMLRGVGAVLLVAAASSFMFRDWDQQNDVVRYLLLLAQLVLLAGAGFVCALAVREQRGARTFLSLVVAVVPVHFAVLGGVVYSQLALDAGSNDLPQYAIWRAPDVTTAVLLALGAQLVLAPVTFIAMLTLVRRDAWRLTLAFLALNAVILVPVRNADTIALLSVGVVLVTLFLQLRMFSGAASYATPQGRFVRAMLAVPAVLLVGRTTMHYPLTLSFVGAVALAAALALFLTMARLGRDRASPLIAASQAAAAIFACVGWTAIACDLGFRFELWTPPYVLLSIALPCAIVIWLLSFAAVRGKLWYRRAAALAAAAGASLDVLLFAGELGTELVCVAAGLGILVAGAYAKQKLLLVLGAATAGVGCICLVGDTLSIEALTHWGSLTAIGVVLIFGASFMDRARQYLSARMAGLRVSLREWSY